MKKYFIIAILLFCASLANAALVQISSPHFNDELFTLWDNGDPTKRVVFELSGLTTDTTRTITLLDASGTPLYNVDEDISPSLGGDLDVNDFAITNASGTVDIKPDNETEYLEISHSGNEAVLKAVGSAGAELRLEALASVIISPDTILTLQPIEEIWLRPSGDFTDYFLIRTIDNIPHIETLGFCDFHFVSSGGTFDFDDDNRVGTGNVEISSSGQFLAPVGSVDLPVYAAVASPNTGMYFGRGGNRVQFSVFNSLKFYMSETAAVFGQPVNLQTNALTVNSIEVIGADGEVNKAAVEDSGNWDDAYTHVSNDGSDHSFIDQDLQASASPVFAGLNIEGGIPILTFKDNTDTGDSARGYQEWRDSNNVRLGFFGNSSYTHDDLVWKNESSGGHLLLETTGTGIVSSNTNFTTTGTVTWSGGGSANANDAYTHVSNNGTDHSFIDQNVTTAGTPDFDYLSLGEDVGLTPSASATTDKLFFQALGTDQDLNFNLFPSGTSGAARFTFGNSSDTTNYAFLRLVVNGAVAQIITNDTGTNAVDITTLQIGETVEGDLLDIEFIFNNVEKAHIDNSGNMQADGTIDATGGFKDNGSVGVDTSLVWSTAVSGDCNSMTVSGGIITAYTTVP